MRTWIFAGAAFGAAALVGRTAEAREQARLGYAVDAGVEKCPTEQEVRDAIAARLGYDPFVDEADRDVRIHLSKRRAGGIDGALDVRGPRPGHRDVSSPRGDCREVVDALAVAAAIAIDPASLAGPVPAPEPEPPPSPPPEPKPEKPPADEPRPITPPATNENARFRLSLRPELVLGELPAVGGGAVVAFGMRFGWASASIEAEGTAPGQHLSGRGAVTASLATVGIVPCGHYGVVVGCVVARAGVMRAEGEGVPDAARASEAYAAMGARAGVEIPLPFADGAFFVLAHAEVVAPLTRIGLRLESSDAWSVPTFAGRLALGAGMRF